MTAELRLDLDIMERNAQRMATELSSLGKQWRPHVKSHSQPRIAQKMIELGACGVTAATVPEVEVMAEAGIPSVLLAHLAVSEADRDRLAAASKLTEVLLIIDHYVHAELYSETAQKHGITLNLLVDIDIGMGRTGSRPRVEASQLAAAASQLPGVQIRGIMGYEGHLLKMPDLEEKRAAIFEAMNVLQQTRDALRERDLNCDIVSAGGTGSFWITGQHPAVTELQAGGGAFGDLFYQQACGVPGLETALTIVADVISRPALTRAVLNCGRKAINPAVHPPEMMHLPGATIDYHSAEHTVLTLDGAARDLKIGDVVTMAVGYSDLTILQHRQIHIYRGSEKVDIWPVIRRP